MIPTTIRRLRYSFNARIIVTTVLLLTATTMALNTYFYFRASADLETELIHHNQSMARILAANSRLGVFTGDTKALTASASLIGREDDCQVIIFYGNDGAPLLRHGCHVKPSALIATLSDREILARIAAHRDTPSFFFRVGDILVMVEPVLAEQNPSAEELFFKDTPETPSVKGKTIGHVVLAITTSGHQRKVRTMFLRDTATTTGVTILGCLIIFQLIQYLTRPLRQLTQEVIGHPLSPEDVNAAGGEKAITNDFSRMVAVIRHAFQTITDLKETLEEKVKERTRQLAATNQELTTQRDGLTRANQRLAITLSELQSTQAQLVQSEKMAALGTLIAGLSHEIKNSINFISCSVPLLKKTLAPLLTAQPGTDPGLTPPTAKVMGLLANIDEGIDRTVRVIDDLAHFCHDTDANMVATDIIPGLKATISILRHEYRHRIEIVEEHSLPLPPVRGRSSQLNQVFLNILVNAAQAIPERGTIRVATRADATSVYIAITDSGQGIKERDLGRIYSPFFTTKEVGQGTGLGLSISYNIVKNHGGALKVNSTPGQGTTFEVVLPVLAS